MSLHAGARGVVPLYQDTSRSGWQRLVNTDVCRRTTLCSRHAPRAVEHNREATIKERPYIIHQALLVVTQNAIDMELRLRITHRTTTFAF